jgi:hypothetical protein
VLGVLVAKAAVLAWLGVRKLQSIEPPTITVGRRVESLRGWWANDLTLDPRSPGGLEEGEDE